MRLKISRNTTRETFYDGWERLYNSQHDMSKDACALIEIKKKKWVECSLNYLSNGLSDCSFPSNGN